MGGGKDVFFRWCLRGACARRRRSDIDLITVCFGFFGGGGLLLGADYEKKKKTFSCHTVYKKKKMMLILSR